MKRYLLILAGILVLIVGVIATWYVLRPKTVVNTQPGTTFPTGSTVPGASATVITIPASNGTAMSARNFLSDTSTYADPVNKGYYYLGSTPSEAKTFQIEYIKETHYFNIELLAEPLGAARLEAEQQLTKSLGLTNEQLCSLNYSVGTPTRVNDAYAGINLGFSFCPNATKLP